MHALSLFSAVLLSLSTLSNIAEANYKGLRGFSIDLIHRDSPLSPFYNSSVTPSELIRNAAFRSISRAKRFRLSNQKAQSSSETDIIPDYGNYLMRIFIGTPPVETLAIADTGSDLTWVQCSPCDKCYPQNAPLFDPTKSSSYVGVSCDSKPCTLLPRGQSTCGASNQCMYYYSYVDMSFTGGELAMDSINFGTSDGTSVSFPKSVFGCGRNNGGMFRSADAGLVGLGNGPLSLVSQLGDVLGHKFSYCLLPFFSNSKSKLKFGEGTISGNGVVSTPLKTIPEAPSAYYILNLEGVSVGQQTVKNGQNDGSIVIDSGTTLTSLPSSFYNDVEALAKEAIGLEAVQDPPTPFKLCYTSESFESSSKNFPEFVVHFTGGADLSLKSQNLLLPLQNLVCFAVVPTDRVPFYGNVAQINFQVEYDLDGRKVSFAPADCTNY